MTPERNGDSHAFPSSDQTGMTLREWYAGMALQGMNANPELMQYATAEERDGSSRGTFFERLAKKAFEQADAMLKESVKPPP